MWVLAKKNIIPDVLISLCWQILKTYKQLTMFGCYNAEYQKHVVLLINRKTVKLGYSMYIQFRVPTNWHKKYA